MAQANIEAAFETEDSKELDKITDSFQNIFVSFLKLKNSLLGLFRCANCSSNNFNTVILQCMRGHLICVQCLHTLHCPLEHEDETKIFCVRCNETVEICTNTFAVEIRKLLTL